MPFVFHKTTAINSRIVYDENEENINIRLRLFYIGRNFSYYEDRFSYQYYSELETPNKLLWLCKNENVIKSLFLTAKHFISGYMQGLS